MFAHVRINESIELPYFPEQLDHTNYDWQSKRGVNVYNGPHRLTENGKLERQETIFREKTEEEKREEAEKWGFNSWEEYTAVYDSENWDINEDGIVPDEVDWDSNKDNNDDMPPTFVGPSEKIVDERIWLDCNKHGNVEFHAYIKEGSLDILVGYEARFNRGDLEDVMFLGCRNCKSDDPVEHAVQQIEEWRNSRSQNE